MSWSRKASEHEADHREAKECGGSAGVTFELSHQSAISTDPSKRPLNDPALWQNYETMCVRALDDLDLPAACRANRSGGLCARIAAIGVDAFDERKAGACLPQQVDGGVPVLNVGREHDDVQQETERVDEDMAFASGDLFTRVIALRVQSRAPF